MRRYKRSLTRHLLNAAKLLIPRHWKSTSAQIIAEWLHGIEEIYNMEEMVAIAKESTEKLHKLWTPWIMFCYSDRFLQLTG